MSDRRGQDERPAPASAGTAAPEPGPTIIDVTPIPETAGAESAPPRRGFARGLALILGIVLGAVATSPYWAPPIASVLPWGTPPPPPPVVMTSGAPADLAPLQTKIAALEAKIAELSQAQQRAAGLEPRLAQAEQRLANAAPNPRDAQQAAQQIAQQTQALSSLADRLATLEQRVAAVQTAASNDTAADTLKSTQADVQALSQKLAEQVKLLATLQRTETRGGDREGAALLIAVGQLRAVLATSRPYGAELRAAEALACEQSDARAALQKLGVHAEQGIPTLAMLAQRFPPVIEAVARAAPLPSDGGWLDRASSELKRVFHVRRVAERQGSDAADTDSVLVAAEKALNASDLAGAVASLRRLSGPAAEAAKPWLDDAGARLDADQAMASLDGLAVRGLLATPAAGAKP
jgi:hypothetical protein